MAQRMPVCFVSLNGQMIKVNHKNRITTAYKSNGFEGIDAYAGKVTNAYKYAQIRNSLPTLDA